MAKKDEFEFNTKPKREKKEKPVKEEKEPEIKLSDDGDFDFDKKVKREKAKKEPKERKIKDDEGSFEIGGKKKSEKPMKEPKEKKIKLDDDDVSLDGKKKEKKPFSHYVNRFLWGKNYADLDKTAKKKKWYRPTLIFTGLIFLIVAIVITILILTAPETPLDPMVSMEIVSYPNNMDYFVGEDPSFYGLEILVTYRDGTKETIDHTQCEITGFDSSVPTENTIYVTYKEHTITFSVTIKDNPIDDNPVGTKFNGLTFKTLPKTEYKVGDALSVKGGVLVKHYEDGSTQEVKLQYSHLMVDFTTDVPGTYTVKAWILEDGYMGVVTYDITITE